MITKYITTYSSNQSMVVTTKCACIRNTNVCFFPMYACRGGTTGFESGGGDFASGASKLKFLTPCTFWPVGGQNIA